MISICSRGPGIALNMAPESVALVSRTEEVHRGRRATVGTIARVVGAQSPALPLP
jgi:hypothetical protein